MTKWAEHRFDFAVGVEMWQFAVVDAFYSNLERTLGMYVPGIPAEKGDLDAADTQVQLAKKAFKVVFDLVATSDDDKKKLNVQLAKAGMPVGSTWPD